MITYKGSKLVIGKNFIYEGEKIKYLGKIFGDMHHFEGKGKVQIVMTENEIESLRPYSKLYEHSLLEEQDNAETLLQLVVSYTDDQLHLCHDEDKDKLWNALKKSFQEEINKFEELGFSYKVSHNDIEGNSQYLLTVIMDFLKDTQRDVSGTSLPNIYAQLNNFVYNIDRIGGDK